MKISLIYNYLHHQQDLTPYIDFDLKAFKTKATFAKWLLKFPIENWGENALDDDENTEPYPVELLDEITFVSMCVKYYSEEEKALIPEWYNKANGRIYFDKQKVITADQHFKRI